MGEVICYLCNHFECNETQLAVVWCWLLLVIAFFQMLARHTTQYDEEHTITRARVLR